MDVAWECGVHWQQGRKGQARWKAQGVHEA